MTIAIDSETIQLFSGVLALLVVASLVGFVLHLRMKDGPAKATIQNLNARIRAWWFMCAVFGVATVSGPTFNVVMFAVMSFFALREFLTMTPTRRADHTGLFFAFFLLLPLQYYFVAIKWYGMFSIFMPVYGFLFIPVVAALTDNYQDFLARTAKVQWGLMVCVYCVSYAPALLTLEIPGYQGTGKLLFYLVCIVQLSDVFQYVWGKLLGKHKVAPQISPSKTLEGLIGGVLTATAIGGALHWATPFSPLQSTGMAFLVCVLGFFGGLTMSAIKRDRGAKDWGTMIEGHGGMMDRIDSLCFAAPVFFHVTRYYFTP
jgi:phosphatidate cytidylyltransferase